MSFDYSCFISYRGSKDAMTQQFIDELVCALNLQTGQLLNGETAYLDKDRLQGGDRYNVVLPAAMVKSYCMVAVVSPGYIRSDYCRREYFGMLKIEEVRRNRVEKPPKGRSLVIPIHVWGQEEDLPKRIQDNKHLIKMPYGLLNRATPIERDPNFIPFIEKLGKIILSHAKDYLGDQIAKAAVECCKDFTLPEVDDIESWTPAHFAEPPFPGKKRRSTSKRNAKR